MHPRSLPLPKAAGRASQRITMFLPLAALVVACDPSVDDQLDPAAPLEALDDAAHEPRMAPQAVTTFTFSTADDVIAQSMHSQELLAGYPEGVTPLDEAAIANGFLGAVKIHDEQGEVVGFGVKQAEMMGNEIATTFALTLPGRGTLMLGEVENVTELNAEVIDMFENEDLLRSFEPPLTVTTTIPGTGKIIGGTGEFAHAHGVYQGTQAVHEIDLIERSVDITYTLEISSL